MTIRKACFLLAFLAISSAGHTELVRQSNLTVNRLLTDAENYGGCMAALQGYNAPAGCGTNWIALDCEGVQITKAAGRRSYEIAQMALALEKQVLVVVDTELSINGYCVAKRMDLIN